LNNPVHNYFLPLSRAKKSVTDTFGNEKNMRISKHIKVSIASCVALLAVSSSSFAYLSSGFNAKSLIGAADLVFHGRVLSVGKSVIEQDASFQPPLSTEGKVARLRVLNVIKGTVVDHANVVFRLSTSTVSYTALTEGEECILFLRRKENAYGFVDDHNGILAIPIHAPLRYDSEIPADRMVAELAFGTAYETTRNRLVCIEQLGRFASDEAVQRLQELALEDNMAVRARSFIALIDLDHPPGATELVSLFERKDDTYSLEKYGTTAYSNCHLKGAILNAIESRFNVIGRDFDLQYSSAACVARRNAARLAAKMWKEFDLIGFLGAASWKERDTSSVRGNEVIAEIIGRHIDEHGVPAQVSGNCRTGSKAIVIDLLGSKSQKVRCAAALAIDRMISEPHKFPYPRYRAGTRGLEAMDTYVNACIKWLAAHKEWSD
jgi:hypothetical protein